ncbi:MAG TPA: hypothetical protein VF088_09350 [Pyrinomonadaceae bacterium]
MRTLSYRTFFLPHFKWIRRLALIAPIGFAVVFLLSYAASATQPALLDNFLSAHRVSDTKEVRLTHDVDRLLLAGKLKEPVSLRFISPLMEPVVYTDKVNYFPGEWAHITGFGFAPYEAVTLQIIHTDGTAEGGEGHEPWSVYADANGNFTSDWFLDPDDSAGSRFLLTATGNTSGLTAQTTFTDGLADIDTCANGTLSAPVQCTGENWDNGNLNASKSHYAEGDSVPYRARFDGLIPGNTYTLTIGFDTTKSGKHAFDYLTSFDRTETQPGNNPCTQKQGADIINWCRNNSTSDLTPTTPVTLGIPIDNNVRAGQDGIFPSGDDITQIPGVFSFYNATAPSVVGGPYTLVGTYAGDSTTEITVQFTASNEQVVLAWSGHISTRLNWGLSNSAIAISGSPYHMRLEAMTCPEGCNVGQQDHQLSATAVFFPVQLTIVKETNPDTAPSHSFSYTTTGIDVAPFSLTPPNGTTPDSHVFSLTDTSTRTITETDPQPSFSFTSLTCNSVDGGAGTSTPSISNRTVTINPVEGEIITCTYVNTLQPKLTVTKKIVGGNGTTDSFDVKVDGVTKIDNAVSTDPAGTSVGPFDSTVGSHTVTETFGDGSAVSSDWIVTFSGDCDSSGNVSLAAGDSKQCTVTNTKKPKLTVTKVLVPSNDTGLFNLQIDGVTKAANVGNNGTTGAQVVSIGSHTVGETAGTGTSLSDYSTVISGDCDSSGNVSLAAGDNKSCTITNTRKARLTVTKTLVPSNDTGLFNLKIDGTTYASDVGNNGTTGVQFVNIGSHTVSETAGTGTSLGDYTSVIGGDCDSSGNVTLAAGDNKTCTITNTRKPKLTVTKILVPSSDTGLFNLQIDGVTQAANVGNNGTTGAQFVTIGSHSVGETAGTGTSLSDYTTVIGGDCAANGSVTLAAGDNKTCTITNTRKPKLTVTKILVPSSDSGLFNLQIDGVTQAANVGDGGTTGAQFVTIGSHSVGETAGTGTSLSDYTTVIGGDCATNGSVSLAAGDNKTCTITNTRKPKLTVTKILVPSNDVGLFNLQIDGVTQAANVGDGGTTGAQFVTIGSHTVGETAGTGTSLGDYSTVIGGDCAANGSVTLAAGDNKTCTITNTRKPKLTVTKILIPSNDTGKFNLQIDAVTQAANVGDGGTTGAQFVSIGAHTVGETAGTGTSLSDYTTVIGGDCDASGNVTVAAGDNKTCTITNTRKPKLTVTKILVPSSDTGKFNLQIDGVTQAANVGNNGTTGAQFVGIGSHSVGETAGTGTSLNYYNTVIGGDCDAAGNVSLAAGDNKTCTITNTRKPKLTVTKILVPSNDTGLFNLQIDGVTQAANVGNNGTTGAKVVTIGAHTVGETAGTGTSLGDYTTVIGGDCDAAGNVSLAAGDNKTCTITNTRRPRLTVTKILLPSNDTGLFNLQIDSVTKAANVGNNGTTGAQFVTIGSHTVGETAGTGTSLGDYTTVIGGDCAANGSVSLAAGDNKTCTITNTKKGTAQVVKTVSGVAPAAGQTFTFELRQGASTSSDGTVLESKNTDASGSINFTTKLVAGQTYQICEWVFPGWNTNLAGDGPLFVPNSIIPPALPNPNVNNLTVCANFSVQPGQNRTFNVNNTPPPGGRALTIGFWKNWSSCTGGGQKPTLDLALGIASAITTNPPGGLVVSAQNPGSLWPNYAASWYLVLKGNPISTPDNTKPAADCSRAVNLLNKSTSDGKKKMASDPLFNLTAQLIAAELNRFMGAGISGFAIADIDRAVLLNGKYKFDGLTYSPKLTTADANTANCLATQLDNYNNGRPVGLCP